jgi:hypothetical protein
MTHLYYLEWWILKKAMMKVMVLFNASKVLAGGKKKQEVENDLLST